METITSSTLFSYNSETNIQIIKRKRNQCRKENNAFASWQSLYNENNGMSYTPISSALILKVNSACSAKYEH